MSRGRPVGRYMDVRILPQRTTTFLIKNYSPRTSSHRRTIIYAGECAHLGAPRSLKETCHGLPGLMSFCLAFFFPLQYWNRVQNLSTLNKCLSPFKRLSFLSGGELSGGLPLSSPLHNLPFHNGGNRGKSASASSVQ